MRDSLPKQVDTSVDALAADSVNSSALAIGARIKAARKALGLTQDRLAILAGATSKRGLQDNEAGKSTPGVNMVGALLKAGINANWLIAGEGPMLLKDLRLGSEDGFDIERWHLAFEAVEEGLIAAKRTMPTAKKWELIEAVYDLFEEPSMKKENVLKLVKFAA